MRFIAFSWLANVISLWVVAWIFSGVTYNGFGRLVIAGAIFGVLNTVLKPLLLLITLPLAIVTLGIAWFGERLRATRMQSTAREAPAQNAPLPRPGV